MNPRRVLVLVLALCAAAVGVRLLSHAGNSGEVKAPVRAPAPLLSGDPQRLERFTVHHPDERRFLRLERKAPGVWELTEPLVDRAEPAAVQAALAALFGEYQPPRAEWSAMTEEDLGLAPARAVVEARFRGGEAEELRIGAMDFTGDWHVARRRDGLVRLSLPAAQALMRPAPEWRDRRVFAQPNAIQRLEWRPQGDSGLAGFTLQRRENKWYLYQPFSAPLEPVARQAVARLLGARSEVLPEERITEEQAAAMREGGRIEIQGGAGTDVVWLHGGYAWAESRPYRLPVFAEDFQVLRSHPDQMRSRRLLDLEPREVVSIRMRSGGREIVLRRQGTGWSGPGGVFMGEGLPTQGIPDDPFWSYLNRLVETLCGLEHRDPQPCPDGDPAGEILLSRSLTPVERGGQVLLWWREPEGRSLAATPGNRECVPVPGAGLDTVFQDFLHRFEGER